jgi:hypothetical protein
MEHWHPSDLNDPDWMQEFKLGHEIGVIIVLLASLVGAMLVTAIDHLAAPVLAG